MKLAALRFPGSAGEHLKLPSLRHIRFALLALQCAPACWSPAERCWSGRTGLPAKQLSGVNPDRGFESLPLRHRFSLAPDFGPELAALPRPPMCFLGRTSGVSVGRRGGPEMFRAINPATEELIREYPEHDETEVGQRLKKAEEAFGSWRRFDFAER